MKKRFVKTFLLKKNLSDFSIGLLLKMNKKKTVSTPSVSNNSTNNVNTSTKPSSLNSPLPGSIVEMNTTTKLSISNSKDKINNNNTPSYNYNNENNLNN